MRLSGGCSESPGGEGHVEFFRKASINRFAVEGATTDSAWRTRYWPHGPRLPLAPATTLRDAMDGQMNKMRSLLLLDALITLWGTTGIATYNYTFGESCDIGGGKPTRMLDPTKIPPRDAGSEVREQFLEDLISGTDDGLKAARIVAAGGPPDIDVLNNYAQALEVIRIEVAQKRLSFGWVVPAEDDVQSARHLVELIREGAPREALIEPARRAARVMTDPWELEAFHGALYCLESEASRVQHLARIVEVLDQTLGLFERGCNVAGFVPTPVDIAKVRRLREIAATDGAEAQAPRLRLVKELQARLPPGSTREPFGPEEFNRILYQPDPTRIPEPL